MSHAPAACPYAEVARNLMNLGLKRAPSAESYLEPFRKHLRLSQQRAETSFLVELVSASSGLCSEMGDLLVLLLPEHVSCAPMPHPRRAVPGSMALHGH